MIAIIAPARNMRPVTAPGVKPGRPLFAGEASRLAAHLREYSPWQLESLLDVQPERAFQLYDAWHRFDTPQPAYPALLAFYGAAYRNMAPQQFTPDELAFAQAHLRILSALYGMLRPLDGITDHRLGLKRDFMPEGRDLYAFWGDRLYRALYAESPVVVNLASLEYARLIKPHMRPGDRMVSCRFLVDKPGGPRGTVSTVRAARGLMTRYLITNGIDAPEDLKGFDADGYRFAPLHSSAAEYVFIKARPAAYGHDDEEA